MKIDWVVSAEPTSSKHDPASRECELFSSPEWIPVLKALGATPRFVWSPSRRIGMQLAIFHRLGLKIGYLGFPVAGERFDEMDDEAMHRLASEIQKTAGISLLRLVRSGQKEIAPTATAAFPEARIDRLEDWVPKDKRLQKDLAFARRSSADLQIRGECTDPAACHLLYCEAVRAHGGKVRYTLNYFSCLARLADRDPRLRFYIAVDVYDRIRGFSVVAKNQRTAYYLHGAVGGSYRKTGIGDRLVHRMIRGAAEMGCTRLTMMASPWKQPGLHSYKMKWCENQRLTSTTDYARGLSGSLLSVGSRFTVRKWRKHAQNWHSTK